MKFGIKTQPQHSTWEEILAFWRAADEMPFYESAWNFDHFYPIYGDSSGPCMEAWVTLSALAQATSRLRIGCMVNGMVYRHPAVLASMTSSLDIVSGGRLELGLGAGWNEEECDAYGIDLGTLTERFDRFEEGCEIVTRLLSDETTTFEGRYFNLTEARNEPKGPQRPRPPICIGGAGEKRTLPIVARYADHWNFPGGSAEDFAQKHEVLKTCCGKIGRDPAEIKVSTHLLMMENMSIEDVVRQADAYAQVDLDLAIIYPWPPFRVELLEEVATALADYNE